MFTEHNLLIGLMIVLTVSIFFGMLRSIIGPRRADRIMGINMIGSFATAFLAVLAVYLKESWLLDVCIVYCLMSFLAVVVLAKIHISEKNEEREAEQKK